MPKRKPKDPQRSPDLPHEWIERHIARLAEFAFYAPLELPLWAYRRVSYRGPGVYTPLDDRWQEIRVGESWGGPDTTAFFRCQLTLPESHAGPETYLDIDMDGGETQLSINGRLWQGLDHYRSLVPLAELAQAGETLTLQLEAFIINYPYDARRDDERDFHRFKRARLLKRDPEIEDCLQDLRFVLEAYLHYWQADESLDLENFLLTNLTAACQALGPHLSSHSEARVGAAQVREMLKEEVFDSPLFRQGGTINLCAHSHLDVVYLWPIKETFRKNGRTTSNMLSLMREFPEFRYTQSQPFLYEMLKVHYPQLFEEVKARIAEGRWEVVGGMYIEPDGNLLGPESLVRQIMFGKRFFREELGVDTAVCWLPDVFGVLYTLPQILKKSGIDYFLTAKLNIWNDTTVFPYDSFRWRGPDGSEILTHFPPTHFAQDFTIENLKKQWQDDRQKQLVGENLFIYGWGDGGGGPTRRMAASARRAAHFPGLPQTRNVEVETFFRNLARKRADLPVWDDELYLEAHRGTYTTKGSLKRQNRKAELLYRDAEIISVLAEVAGGPYQQSRLNAGWKRILLNQFHDTLPGTHVPEAVPDVEATYREAFKIGAAVRQEGLDRLAGSLRAEASQADLLLVNTLSWERTSLVDAPLRPEATAVRLASGQLSPVQQHAGRTWFRAVRLPSLGWETATFERGEPPEESAQETAQLIEGGVETPFYRLIWGERGSLSQLVDKPAQRDVLSGAGNVFQCFEDDPGVKFSAWDIAYHLETYQHPIEQVEPWRLVANGPLFAVFSARWEVLNSTIEQEMWLYAAERRIDFYTRLDWRDSRKLLKVAFPLNIRTRSAAYDLPFGHIERPTHRNTLAEQAKFEVCGHKWADLSEGDYGVALLNDCKYGYDARENTLRLSLVRSPVRPDGHSDIGPHQFTYSLYPHPGTWRQAHITRRAYGLNVPVVTTEIPPAAAQSEGWLPARHSLLRVESDSLLVETLKQAESGSGVIVRSFDALGYRGRVPFCWGSRLAGVAECNLLEEGAKPLPFEEHGRFSTQFTPYEIKTHHLQLGVEADGGGERPLDNPNLDT